MDTDGGPQVDGGGEQVLINDERLLIGDDWLFEPCLLLEELIKLKQVFDDWWLMCDSYVDAGGQEERAAD